MKSELVTTGDIARQAGLPLSRVTYAFQRLRIQEDARAGCYRLYRRARLPELIEAAQDIGRTDRQGVADG